MRNNENNITCNIRNITLSLLISTLSFINITLCLSSNFVSALSYESEVGIGFTFNPTLSINISSSDLVISNLFPGSSSDSNIINVSVLTNASHGYTLAANTSSEDLIHSNHINAFSSIATNASLEALTTDNTWGYSYKLSSNNTWSNYNGLPLHTSTSTTLINTDNQISKPIDFKIGAKAGSTQASGTYTGTINFIAVSKPTPKTIDDIVYMQTFGELVSTDLQSVKNSMIKNTTYTLKDARDEQEYTVAKLEDGKIWMTKNLNIAGVTALAADDTDVDSSYIESFTTSNNLTRTGNTIVLPRSSASGFEVNNYSYIYNSGRTDCSSPGCYSYYSWDAATLGSGRSIGTDNTDAPYSICPNGWKLPNTRYGTADNISDLRNLVVSLGGSMSISKYDSTTSPINTKIYNNLTIAPIEFLLTGFYGNKNGFKDGNTYGDYWSATKHDLKNAYSLAFYSGPTVDVAEWYYTNYGYGIRCLAR